MADQERDQKKTDFDLRQSDGTTGLDRSTQTPSYTNGMNWTQTPNYASGTNSTQTEEEDRSDITSQSLISDENQNHTEETSAEIAAPITFDRNNTDSVDDEDTEVATAGTGVGFAALILSIISVFALPILFGAAGIILGFVARSRGANSLGSWAIGIGVASIIVGMFILPFFR